ncbi:MAG: SAM-dependent chlorinase/fluorinase [Solirubrobacterales bacterium]
MSLPITFLSDYGYADEFAGVCRSVIARLAPDSAIVDLTHGVPRHDVRRGSAMLARAIPFTEPGVHLAVVDPGVGSERRAVAVLAGAEGRLLVGPDNGLLGGALETLGGAVAAVDLAESRFALREVSSTFHGRDLFAPVAAALARGAPLEEAGEPLEPATLVALPSTTPRLEGDRAVLHVASVDGFGNLALDLPAADRPRFIEPGAALLADWGQGERRLPYARSFAEVGPGEALIYSDSSGALALALNRESAARRLGLAEGDEVVIWPAG